MNYIYDILLNFKEDYIDFYDWNKSDNIIHIRKIPIIKVSSEDLLNIRNNKVKFSDSLKEKIKDKTEYYTSTGVKRLPYAFLLCDANKVLGINIFKTNNKKSSLLLDEETDILEDVIKQEVESLNYKIVLVKEYSEFKTRNQKEIDLKKIYIGLLNLSDENKKIELVNFFKLKNV